MTIALPDSCFPSILAPHPCSRRSLVPPPRFLMPTPSPHPVLNGCTLLVPHSYLQTLRAYIDMLRMEDRLFAHPSYLKGIQGAVLAYIQLHDRPAGSRGDDEAALLAGMSPEEQKR